MAQGLPFVCTLLILVTAQKEGLFNSVHDLRMGSVYKKVTEPTKIFCTQVCVSETQCVSASFNKITSSCELSLYHPASIESGVIAADDWTLLYKTNGLKDNWTIVFRGTAKIGFDVADSFIGTSNTSLPIPDPECYSWESSACNTHVRSSWIDKWKHLNINEVKVELLTNGQTVAYTIFQNRANDDKITWFSPENILNSSWTDLPSANSSYPNFQLERFKTVGRSFHMYDKYGACRIGAGWMLVSEQSGSRFCSYEMHSEYPVFMYSNESTAQLWASGSGIADVMLISIQ